MNKETTKAILQTLIYSDVFDFPLTKDEIWEFLIGKKIDRKSFDNFIEKSLPKEIVCDNNLYCLARRKKIIETRRMREKKSEKKIKLAKRVIKKISFIPTIKLIGISGALALKNSDRNDDIDLFVITSKGSLWITRLVVVIILMTMGYYRKRDERKVSNKICLNMLIDESALSFSKVRQNLYTAHEIVQMMPVFERDGMYSRFVTANQWIKQYLPNAISRIMNHELRIKERSSLFIIHNIIHNSLFIFERLAKALQLWFIKRHRTTETISDNFLAFHPFDYKEYALKEYNKRLKQYRSI